MWKTALEFVYANGSNADCQQIVADVKNHYGKIGAKPILDEKLLLKKLEEKIRK